MLIKETEKSNSEKKHFTPKHKISIQTSHKKLFNFFTPNVKVKINSQTIIDACVELITVNGRPYSMLNDTGFRKIIEPVLKGLNKKLTINSDSIK